jgi:hypothetical protein
MFDPQGSRLPVDGGPGDDGTVDGRPDGADIDAWDGPPPPLEVTIPAVDSLPSEGGCPADKVNRATEQAVTIVVRFGVDSSAENTLFVVVTDAQSGEIALGSRDAPAGQGAVTFENVDLSGMAEGELLLEAHVEDDQGKVSPTVSRMVVKDTQITLEVDPVVDPTNESIQAVSGVTDSHAQVMVENLENAEVTRTTANDRGYFEDLIELQEGQNTLAVQATDEASNLAQADADFRQNPLQITFDATAIIPFMSGCGDEPITHAGTPCNGGPASFGFIDGDDLPDLYIGGGCKRIYLNQGDGVFVEQSVTAVIKPNRSGVWGDFDDDGDWDLFVTGYIPRNPSTAAVALYENRFIPTGTVDLLESEVFEYVAQNPEGAVWLDYDRDGWLDLFVQDGSANDGGNTLWRNVDGQHFADESSSVPDPYGNANWAAACDFDTDGQVEVAVGDATGMLLVYETNAFVDRALDWGLYFSVPNGKKQGFTFGDFDNDGDFDFFVPSGDPHDASNVLYRYDAVSGEFADDASTRRLAEPEGWSGAAWGDMNNDGWLDLVYVGSNQSDQRVLYIALNRNVGFDSVGFSLASHPTPDSFRTVLLDDIDADGDLDVFLANGGGPPWFFLNGLNEADPLRQNLRYLRVIVRGAGTASGGTNYSAVGAVVKLSTCDTNVISGTREVNGGRGNGAQDSPVLFFGGVKPSRCYRVEVMFTGGGYTAREVLPRDYLGDVLIIEES